jgi:transposase
MPKGRVLSLAEREAIAELHRAGASGREIAKKLERSKTVVLNFLRAPAQYGRIKRSGRKRALSSEDERRLYVALFRHPPPPAVTREQQGLDLEQLDEDDEGVEEEARRLSEALRVDLAVLSTSKSAEQIKREFGLPLSVRRIQQLLSEWRRHARRQVDSHAVGTSDDATESDGEHETPPAADKVAPGGDQASDSPTSEVGIPAAGDQETVCDAISSADAMLALPDEKLDTAGVKAAMATETGHVDAPKLREDGCLSSLTIEEASTFPELHLTLTEDKVSIGASLPVASSADSEQTQATDPAPGKSNDPPPASSTLLSAPSSSSPARSTSPSALDPPDTAAA